MKTFRKGELLFHDGEKGDYMLMVLQGTIECAIKKTPEEKNISRGFLLKAFSDLKSSYYTKKVFDQKIREDYPPQVFMELDKGGEDVDLKLKDILFYRKELRVISEAEALMVGLGQNEFTPGLKETENRRYYGGGLFNYKIVFSAKEGAIIGEQALETKAPRAATCYASETTYALVLSKRSFDNFFSGALDDQTEKNDFIELFFPNLSENKLVNLSYMFEKLVLERRNLVFKEGDTLDCYYLIQDGSIELTKNISKEIQILRNKKRRGEENEDKEREILSNLKVNQPKQTLLEQQKLGIFSRMGILGVEAMFQYEHIPKRFYSARVISSQATLYKLSWDNLSSAHILLGDKRLPFLEDCRRRLHWLENRVKMSKDPLSVIEKGFVASKKSIRQKAAVKDPRFSKKGMKYTTLVIPEEEKSFNQ